jgi:hypothetical protein
VTGNGLRKTLAYTYGRVIIINGQGFNFQFGNMREPGLPSSGQENNNNGPRPQGAGPGGGFQVIGGSSSSTRNA